MTSRIPSSSLIQARAWRLEAFALAAIIQVGASWAFVGPIQVPLRDARAIVTPLLGIAFAFAFASASRALTSAMLEARHPARAARRLTFLGIAVLSGVASACVAALAHGTPSASMLVRNLLLFVGVVALGGDRDQDASLTLLAAYCAAAWLLGTPDFETDARWWAIPMLPVRHAGAWVVTLTLFLLGAARFAFGRRSSPR